MALALIVSEKMTYTQNLTKVSEPYKVLKIERRVNLNCLRCMHDPSFMALALIVSEKMT